MPVDVTVATTIAAPLATVAAYAEDPAMAPRWYQNIRRAEWLTPPPVRLGSRFRFEARFLGRTLRYTYEVVAYEPARRIVMRTAEGPFPMETSYAWSEAGPGMTRMELRNRGEPEGFSRLLAPVMAAAMRRATSKDLRRVKAILESGA